MATKKFQRYGIIVILVVTVIGTLGSFAVMILGTKNDSEQSAHLQKLQDEYQKAYTEYQAKVAAQGDELSAQYYDTFSPYASQVGTFDLDGVTALVTEDLVVGEGSEITGATGFSAYYIGWNPKGKIFDESINTATNKLKSPLSVAGGLDAANLIDGWKEGMKGMRIGGIRLITIPSDKAYKEAGQGDDIPPNTPLKFVVMTVASPAEIPQPEFPTELLSQYSGS